MRSDQEYIFSESCMKKWIQYKTYFFFLKEQKIKIVDTQVIYTLDHIEE